MNFLRNNFPQMLRPRQVAQRQPESLRALAQRFNHRMKHNEGSALVEMAVILPVMMLLITGVCSLGIVLNNYLVLTSAVQSGAMQVALSAGQSNIDPCNIAATQVVAAAPTLNPSNITYTFNFNGTAAGPFKGTAASTCSADNQYLTQGSAVSVNATYPTQMIIFGWRPSTLNLTTTTSELAQ